MLSLHLHKNPFMAKFQIGILGCGSATPSLRHQPSCQVIDIRDNLYMIDCGEGAQLQARRMKVKFSRLGHIFISHLHGDHCLGLPGLLSTLALHQTGGSLTVHTFREGIDMFKRIMDFFCRERTYDLRFEVIAPERATVYENDAITVETVPLNHRVPTVGYIFREKPKPRHLNGEMVKFHDIPVSLRQSIKNGADYVKPDGAVIPNALLTTPADPVRSYAYISDTAYYPAVIPAIQGVDLLYHEATYTDGSADKAAQRFHSTARQAAMIARDASVGRLLLGHYSKSYLNEDEHLSEAREIFPQTIAATEGMKIDLL